MNELGRFDYLLHILKNLLRFVKYFQKKFSLGIYAPTTENPQFTEIGDTREAQSLQSWEESERAVLTAAFFLSN